MEQWLNYGRYALAAIGTLFTAFIGGWDNVAQVLVMLVVLDYLTGVLAAWVKKELSSEIGARGIAKKVLVFVMVGLASLLDQTGALGQPVFRTLVIWFYIANEGLSIIENAAVIGVPIPSQLVDALNVLKKKGDTKPPGVL